MLDVMAEAEAQYEAAAAGEEGTAAPPTRLAPSPRRGPTRNAAVPSIPAATRAKVVDRLRAALRANQRFAQDGGVGGASAAGAAAACEAAIYGTCRSKTVYQSVASNAVRVAASVGDLAELLRVASGAPKDTAGGGTGSAAVAASAAGLQGYVLKPEVVL